MEIDLVDDIWSRVFNSFGVDRARLASVCKRWAKVILHPNSWRVLEVELPSRTFRTPQKGHTQGRKSDGIELFITKYCTNLVDCHLTARNSELVPVLHSLLQIKTLRRLYLDIVSEENGTMTFGRGKSIPQGEKLLRAEPQCKGLELLTLKNIKLCEQDLNELLRGLPSLEELYLHQSIDSISVAALAPARKLKRVVLEDNAARLEPHGLAAEFAAHLPNLEIVICNTSFSTMGSFKIATSFNVHLVSAHVLCKRLGNHLTQLSRLISPRTHPSLLMEALLAGDSVEIIRYLVRTLNYDVNYVASKFIYPIEAEKRSQWVEYPLVAALKTSTGFGMRQHLDPEALEELLKMGANPNSPMWNKSPLSHCRHSLSFFLLLRYGANPYKLVKGRPAFWSIFKTDFSDPEVVLSELLGTCDINAEYGEEKETLLSRTLSSGSQEKEGLVRLLVSAGIKWTENALEEVAESLPLLFTELVLTGSVDLEISRLKPSVILGSLNENAELLEPLRNHLKTLTADNDAPHLSPMHYAALLTTSSCSESSEEDASIPKSGTEKKRVHADASDIGPRWTAHSGGRLGASKDRLRVRQFGTAPTKSSSKAESSNSFEFGAASSKISEGFSSSSSSGFSNGTAPSASFGTAPSSSTSKAEPNTGFGTSQFGTAPSKGSSKADSSTGFGFGFSSSSGFSNSTAPSTSFGTAPSKGSSKAEPSNSFGFSSSKSTTVGFSSSSSSSGFSNDTAPYASFGTAPSSSTSKAKPNTGFGTSQFGTAPSKGSSKAEPSTGFGFGFSSSSSGFSNNTAPSTSFGTAPSKGSSKAKPSTSFELEAASSAPFASFGTAPSKADPSSGWGKGTAMSKGQDINTSSPQTVEFARLDSIDEVITLLNTISINEKTNTGATPLLLLCKSARHSCTARIKGALSLIKHGANVNFGDMNGWTPLHAALYVGSWQLANLLLDHGANINAQDVKGMTPLMALMYGVRHAQHYPFPDFEGHWAKLIARDVDLTLVDQTFRRSLVHLMAGFGTPAMFECAEAKLLKPELVNARDIEGFTPLHYAVMFDNIDTVQLLIRYGADVNAQTRAMKLTPAMMLYNMVGNTGAMTYLAHYNTLPSGRLRVSEVNKPNFLLSFVEPSWLCPHEEQESVGMENLENLESMLTQPLAHSNVLLTDSEGNNLLHIALNTLLHHVSNVISCATIFRAICSMDSFKSMWATTNANGETAAFQFIRAMCEQGLFSEDPQFRDLLVLLKKEGLTLEQCDADGRTAWEYVLNTLLGTKAKIQVIDLFGPASFVKTRTIVKQPNPITMSHYNPTLLQSVVRAFPGAITERDENGGTPLMHYVSDVLRKGTAGILKLEDALTAIDVFLGVTGVDVNAQDKNGSTALHIACKYFHIGLTDAIDANVTSAAILNCWLAFKLVEAGARPDLKNNSGQTPLDFAPLLLQHYSTVYPLAKSSYERLLKKEPTKMKPSTKEAKKKRRTKMQ